MSYTVSKNSILDLLNIPAVSKTILGTGSAIAAIETISSGAVLGGVASSILFPVLVPAVALAGAVAMGSLLKKDSVTVATEFDKNPYPVRIENTLRDVHPLPEDIESKPSQMSLSEVTLAKTTESRIESAPEAYLNTERTIVPLTAAADDEYIQKKAQELNDMYSTAEAVTGQYEPIKNHSEYPRRLRSILSDKNIMNKELSARVGVTESFLSKLSNGHKMPSRNTAIAICIALNLGIEKAVELLSLTGHALSTSSSRDRIVLACMFEKCSVDATDEALTSQGFPGLLKN